MSNIELGRFGIWRRAADATTDLAREVEGLGFGALWVGGSPSGDLGVIEGLIEATESIPVASGIVNMWRSQAETVAVSYHRINERFPDRFLLGVGIGHPESVAGYHSPQDTMVRYLDGLAAAGVPKEHMILAALGPKALRLSAAKTVGSHPYFTTPRHTRMARGIVGDGVILAPEQTVVLGVDSDGGRDLARAFAGRYLSLRNYRNSLIREGWDEAEVEDGGSDRLVDEVVLTGDVSKVAQGIWAHLESGADHVSIQVLGENVPSSYRALAEALGPLLS